MIISLGVCAATLVQIPKVTSLQYFSIISRKTWGMKLIFWLQINTNAFYMLIVSLWVCVARHVQSTQNNKFAISLQYLKENLKDEVNFFYSNLWPGMPKLPKISLLFPCSILRKKWEMKLIFCVQISMKVSYKLILWFLMGMVKHSQSSQNSKFAMSLQYLKKKLEMKLIFCM